MGLSQTIWPGPADLIRAHRPDHPVLMFAPQALQAMAQRFQRGFPGLVTYAVKSNPAPMVLENLAAAGIRGFDVASPDEIALVARHVPGAVMHYHNPVRARAEIRFALSRGLRSWSVDSLSELEKLIALLPADGHEVSVRFALPVPGAAYDFGAKFGAGEDRAARLLARVAAAGFCPSLTFHPGTQCTDPAAWETYIHAAARICAQAGVTARRLNVGGGFPSHRRAGPAPALAQIFARIEAAAAAGFGPARPALVCEPGRGLVADALALLTRVKALRDDGAVFLNDGIYGCLAEAPLMGTVAHVAVFSPEGRLRRGPPRRRVVFGPTCDSIDRLPDELPLPADLCDEDYIVFHGMGAYSSAIGTRFNGFGQAEIVTVLTLAP